MAARLLARGACVVMALAAVAGGLTGCNEEQLKEEIITLQTRLRLAEAEKTDLERDKLALAGENARLKSDLDDASRKLAEKPAPPPPGDKDKFGEGIEWQEDARGVTVTLPGTILFDSGKAVLKSSSAATLNRIAAVIQQDYPGRIVRVEGHTDSQPIKKSGWKDNWELSCERSLAVVRHLVGRGLGQKQVYAAGFGEFMPRDTNATAAGRARNRRVEIVITR